MGRFFQWLRDLFTAFRKGGGTKFAKKPRGVGAGVAPRGANGVKTRKRSSKAARCEGCQRFVKALCAGGEEPCAVCPDCCLDHG